MCDHLESSSPELPVSFMTICYACNNNLIFINPFIFFGGILNKIFRFHPLLRVDSRGQCYLTFNELILHVSLLQRFRFKDGSDGAAHPDEPLVQPVGLGLIQLYGLFLTLTLQTVTNTLLEQST